jgi:hypothetical protein
MTIAAALPALPLKTIARPVFGYNSMVAILYEMYMVALRLRGRCYRNGLLRRFGSATY